MGESDVGTTVCRRYNTISQAEIQQLALVFAAHIYTKSHRCLGWLGANCRYAAGMAQLLSFVLGIPLCLACHPARPPATFAGGGWLPLVAVIQCFIEGVTGTRLLLNHQMNLVGKSCLLLDW